MKLRVKMLVGILGTVVFIFFMIGAVVYVQSNRSAKASSENISMSGAQYAAERISGKLEAYKLRLDGLAVAIERLEQGSANRKLVEEWMKTLLEESPGAISLWVTFEPNGFDALDGQFQNAQGYGPKGVMALLYSRDGSSVTRETLENEEEDYDEDYYLTPLKSAKPAITEPYLYEFASGEKQLMTTIARPLKINGRVTGVLAIDINLQDITAMIVEGRATPNSTAFLVSNRGVVVAAEENALIGKNMAEWNPTEGSFEKAAQSITRGERFAFNANSPTGNTKNLFSVAPVTIEGIETPWSLLSATPLSEAMAEADALVRRLALLFFAGIAVVAAVLFFMIQKIVRPIRFLTERVNVFSTLDFRDDMSKRWLLEKGDEIGDISRALRVLQDALSGILVELVDEAGSFMKTSQVLASLSQESLASAQEVKAALDQASMLSESNAAALEGTNMKTRVVAQTASTTANVAESGAEAAEITSSLGNEVSKEVRRVVSRIDEVVGKSKNSGESIRKVDESVSAITSFVSIIGGYCGSNQPSRP